MDYSRAASVRKKSLTEMIAKKKFEEGQGLGSSIRQAFSEKLQAKAMGFKDTFHPMRLVGALTGSGTIGKSIRTVAGRAMGLSNNDVEHFGGYRRKYQRRNLSDLNIASIPDSLQMDNTGGNQSVGSTSVILEKIFEFMKNNHEEDKLKKQVENSFREEQVDEDERRHQELVKAIREFTKNNKSYVMEKDEEQEKPWYEKIKDWIMDKFRGILDLLNISNVLSKLAFLASPAVLGLLGVLALPFIGKKLLEMLNDVTPNMKSLSPEEAANALSGSEKDIIKSGGRAYLEDIVNNGKERAQKLLNEPASEENTKAILEMGGYKKVKAIAEDTKTYEIPAASETPKMAEKITSREEFAGKGSARQSKLNKWDREFGPFYNEDGTKKNNETPVPAETKTETKTTQTATVETVKQRTDTAPAPSATPVNESKSVPTVSNEKPSVPSLAPAPVFNGINQAPGTMIPKQLSQEVDMNGESAASIVSVNTTNTSVGGSEPTVVSVDSTRVRDPNISRHLRPQVV